MTTGKELMKRTHYQIIEGRADNMDYFQELLNNHLRVGWKLYGDVFFIEKFGEVKYITINQAIINSKV